MGIVNTSFGQGFWKETGPLVVMRSVPKAQIVIAQGNALGFDVT